MDRWICNEDIEYFNMDHFHRAETTREIVDDGECWYFTAYIGETPYTILGPYDDRLVLMDKIQDLLDHKNE